MKIQFEPALEYQSKAIESVAGLFAGQEVNRSEFTVTTGTPGAQGTLGLIESELGIGNCLGLLPEEVFKNLSAIQIGHGLAPSEGPISRDFTIEMETGTGKTYVYLRSAFEMYKRYGFTKFVIVVPSIAIKEGVMKTLEMTGEHFGTLYPEAKGYSFYAYDSAKLGQVRDFATSANMRFMVATIQSLYSVQDAAEGLEKGESQGGKKAERVIHRPNEQTGGERPIDLIRATNPVLIVDEPQSVYGDAGKGKKAGTGQGRKALALLNPLCVLRYSATPLDKTQLVYRLDAVDAYEQKLVKGIEVASMVVTSGQNKPYVNVVEIKKGAARTPPTALLELDVQQGERVTRKMVRVQDGDSLEELTGGRTIYHDLRVGEIRSGRGDTGMELKLPGDEKWLKVGEEHGGIDPDDMARAMIRRTITEHLDKEVYLRPRGLKVLSLFFIDRVENYRSYDEQGNPQKGKYAQVFEDEYRRLSKQTKYAGLFEGVDLSAAPEQVHDGYFSVDRKGRAKDTSGGTADDEGAYNLIMRDKERLLDLNTPLKFIFSHSALREGWDNPNVFQICVLREIGTERERRQTIGRGLRLAVNQSGERVRDDGVNILTVVASESYEDFAENLQKELEEDLGIKFGVVEPDQFAALSTKNAAGEVTALGVTQSKVLHTALRQSGYLSTSNKVEDTLRRDLKAGPVKLPPEFEPLRGEITAILKKLAGRLEIRNADQPRLVQPNRAVLDDPEFRELWDSVKSRTTYKVEVNTGDLIDACVKAVDEMPVIPRTRVQTTVAKIMIDDGGVIAKKIRVSAPTTLQEDDLPLPDLLGALQDRTQLTRRTLSEVLRQTSRLNDFKKNPQAFIETVGSAINSEKTRLLVEGVGYRPSGEEYAMSLLDQTLPTLQNIMQVRKGVYDHVIYDSDVEKAFAQDLELNEAVKVYAKLPNWFTVPTPLGDYNPDWAILIERSGEPRLCFVAETKSTLWTGALRTKEAQKIECGEKHFAVLAQGQPGGQLKYEVVRTLQDVFDKA